MIANQEGLLPKIALCGLAYAFIGQIIHFVGAMLSMNYYTDPAYAGLWSKVMMPSASAGPGLDFFALALLFGFITGCIFAYAYSSWMVCVAGGNVLEKGLNFGFLLFLVAGVTGYLTLFLLLAVPAQLLAYWAVEGFATSIAAGLVIARVFE